MAENPPQSEDCLYLNVFVPRTNNTAAKYVVLVYIHGGGFEWGSSDIFDGKYLSAYGGIIVVTFNYRLGFLGFLRVDEVGAPGNVAIWDQRLVLEWVKSNINSFGGDKNKVTILGTSSGAISAVILGLYPENNGLFQRLIVQGGSLATMEYNLQPGNTPETDYVLKSLGCSSRKTTDTLDCLRNIPSEELTAGVKRYSLEIRKTMLREQFYVPTINGTLVKWNPREISRLDDENVAKSMEFLKSLDFLHGFSVYDGGFIFQHLLDIADTAQFRPSTDDVEKIVESALRMPDNKTFSPSIYRSVLSEYTDWDNPKNPENIRLQVVKLYTDMIRAIPAIQLSRIHASSPVSSPNNYMFLFSAKPSVHVLPTPDWLDGANHADELFYLSVMDQYPFAKQWEKELSYNMVKYWANFVKTGDPNGEDADNSNIPNWPKYGMKNQEYIDIDRNITARSFFKARATNFWLDLLPELINTETKENCTKCHTCTSVAPSGRYSHVTVYLQLLVIMFLFKN